jgi:hypothetical protein
MTASTKAPRKRAPSRKKALHLPESATFTKSGGQEFLLVPVSDFESWLEDQLDAAEARAALADPAPRIPLAEVKRQLGIK